MPVLLHATDPVSFQRRWMSFVFWGVVAIAFGLAVALWPGISLRVLVTLFSLSALAGGVLLVASAFAAHRASPGGWWWISPLPGVLLIVLAIAALLQPRAVSEVFVIAFAIVAMLWGVADLTFAWSTRRYFSGWWVRGFRGLLVVVAGLAVVAFPVAGLVAAAWVLGAWAILVGLVSIALGLWIRATPLP